MDATKVADRQLDTVSEHVHLEKLERLEQDYLRLTRTQRNAEVHTNKEESITTRVVISVSIIMSVHFKEGFI